MPLDALQGCYKDGTNGTQDCRYFAALQLILRLLFPFIFLITREAMLALFSYAVVLGLYVTLFVLVQPYKVTVYNKRDVPLLMSLLFTAFVTCALSTSQTSYSLVNAILCVLFVYWPLLYLVIWSVLQVKHIITHRTWCRKHTQESNHLLPHT